jgi:adenylate cyclase
MDPTNGTALASGAYALAMLGERDRSREWMRRALLLDPENLVMRYNAACTLLGQLGDVEEAVKTLEPFFDKVTSTTWIWHAEADPDLGPIRERPRFKEMLASAKQRLGMAAAAAE